MGVNKKDIVNIQQEYSNCKSKYDSLGKNMVESLKILLKENHINILGISYRIKEEDSFMGKIDRKDYDDPLNEIEDICGIRIICYYIDDIEKIKKIIENECIKHESDNKEDGLEHDQFGYRSQHLIVSIKEEWTKTPNFHNLNDLKCEIQVRTTLMHAWAEIEHKLSYKNEDQAPKHLRRKLHRISAFLEVADEQFQEVKIDSETYQKKINKKLRDKKGNINKNLELNIDTLQAFMDTNFIGRSRSTTSTGELLNEMINYGITFDDLLTSWLMVKDNFFKIENDIRKIRKFAQVGVARTILDLVNNKYLGKRYLNSKTSITRTVKLRKKYNIKPIDGDIDITDQFD